MDKAGFSMGKFLLLAILLLKSSVLLSVDIHWNSEPVVIKNGINNNTIYNVCYGKDGFIWLSTDRGITRYDGFRFRDYPLVTKVDSLSIPLPQAVASLYESSDGLFYLQLYQGGIICFDKYKEKYLPFTFNKPFHLRDILDFCWKDNALYLATSFGLFRAHVVRKEGNQGDFISCTLDEEPLVKGKVTNLCADDESNLYLSTDRKKIFRYDLKTKKTSFIKEYSVVNRLFLQGGYLWICRLWNDIICYDIKSNKERAISVGSIDNVDFSSSYITDLICKGKKTFYLTTWNGLFKLDFTDEELCESPYALIPLTQYEETYHSNIECRMTSVYLDEKQDIFWVSTFGGGIVKFDVSESKYSRVHFPFNSRVSGMVEDGKGYIWLVMADGTLMKSNSPSLSSATHFNVWKKLSGFSGHYHIYKDKSGIIWLGNNLGELLYINPLTDEIKTVHLKMADGKKMLASINQLCMDSRNRLWLATSDGLIMVDPDTFECKKIEPKNESVSTVYAVVEDKEGNIWIGTDKGLKRLEYLGEQIFWKGQYERDNGLEETAVRTIYVNNSNQIYVAYLNVVIRIDGREKDKLESMYTLDNGLTSGHISCMVDDQVGNTWMGNNAGIMTIGNGQEAFYNYLSAGNCSAVCRLKDGRLLWANSWGLIYLDPTVYKVNKGNKRLMLTDIEVNGETLLAGEERNGQTILSNVPEKQTGFVFDSDNNNFRLYFSDLRYGMVQRKIAYRLLPEDKEWRMQLLEEGLWYNRLPAGKYTLQVKLVFPDATEGDVVQIPITVKAKWYHSKWVYWGYGLFFLIVCYLIYCYFEKKNTRKQKHRERELLLREALNLEKVKQDQKQEMEKMRNRLLMLFVQEMRTPLSLIIAPLKDLLEDQRLQGFATRGCVAYRNSLRMLNACNQLLAIYSHDNLNNKLKVAPYQVEKLIDSNLFDIRELLKVYSINLQYEKRIKKGLEFYVDKKKVEFIIHNLLTNAFAHTNYLGSASLIISEMVEANVHYVTVTVEDDGKMPVNITEGLTGESEQIENDPWIFTEVGYSVMQQMVEMHHGTISLENSQEKGTKVVVNLPLDKSVFDADPNIEFVDPEKITDIEPESVETSRPTLMSEEIAPSASTSSKKTLLIVEDQKDIRLYLKVLFNNEYNLLMATNGQEGVDMATKEQPDLIICDVMMPVKDGFECCKEVKEGLETCSIPFIILTAKVEDEDIIRGLDIGADDYVLKPFTPNILKAKVRNLINSRQALKQMYTKLLMLPGTDTADMTDIEKSDENVKVEDPFISSVIKIVEENICKADFSVKKLASEMNMSQPTLYRKVKQSTDYTIIELIRGVRMRRAAVLLKTKKHGVQEVAEMVGYNDIPTFRKHFVDAFGTTPSTYE